jgi:hypothetical protein
MPLWKMFTIGARLILFSVYTNIICENQNIFIPMYSISLTNEKKSSATMLMRSVLFWVTARRRIVTVCRRFGTTHWSRCPETSVNNYHTTPRNTQKSINLDEHQIIRQMKYQILLISLVDIASCFISIRYFIYKSGLIYTLLWLYSHTRYGQLL